MLALRRAASIVLTRPGLASAARIVDGSGVATQRGLVEWPHTRPSIYSLNMFSTATGDEKVELSNVALNAPHSHPSKLVSEKGTSYLLMHPVYDREYVRSIVPKHRPPVGVIDHLAYYSIQTIRASFDLVTGYGPNMTVQKWLTRVVFLETVAGVPGMVGGMIRHLHSLRLMRRDMGWIHTLLEEAENERMHLLTFLQLSKPGIFVRWSVLFAQGIFCNFFFLAYLISPTFCHRMVGYLEEEAVKTYTHLIKDLEDGRIPEWADAKPPPIAIEYWRLDQNATMLDLVLAVRADEACHSYVNHTFAGMKPDEQNPFSSGSHNVP